MVRIIVTRTKGDGMTIRFPALLEDDGQIIAYGFAEIAPEQGSLNFISGFIPLYPIGTRLALVQLCDDIPQEKLIGEVYLSSRNLLRLVSIDEEKLSGILEVFESNTSIKAMPYIPAPEGSLPKLIRSKLTHYKLFRTKLFRRKQVKFQYRVEANIYYVSETRIKFLSIDNLQQGAHMIIDLTTPHIEGINIEVSEVHDFGNIMKAYLCDVVSAPAQYYDFALSLTE
jgi:hypothetical protein